MDQVPPYLTVSQEAIDFGFMGTLNDESEKQFLEMSLNLNGIFSGPRANLYISNL